MTTQAPSIDAGVIAMQEGLCFTTWGWRRPKLVVCERVGLCLLFFGGTLSPQLERSMEMS